MKAVKCIFYGDSGTGKTVLLGSALDVKECNPVLLIDLERGSMSIASKCREITFSELGKPIPGKIDHIKVFKWPELEAIIDYLYKESNPYKTILLDSLTETNYLNLTTVTKTAGRPDAAQIQDYGRSAAQMRKTVREFRNYDDINVFISCLANEDKDESTGIMKVKPALTGKLVGEIPALVDIVGYLTIDKDGETRIMYFQPSNRYVAKDRTEKGVIGRSIENPTIADIFAKVKNVKES